MKYDWYKHHDERNERLKGCSGLLLQPVPIQKQAKRGMVKSSSGNMQGKGDCFTPPCTGDSAFHCSLHLKKWRAAWQREQPWNCELCSPGTLFPSVNRQSCATFWKEKKKVNVPTNSPSPTTPSGRFPWMADLALYCVSDNEMHIGTL